MRLLRLNGRPRFALLRHHEMHKLLIVPEELPLRLCLPQHLAQLLQQLHAPGNTFTWWKALAKEVPFLTEHLPGRNILGIDGDFFRESRKARDCVFEERPEL